MHQTSIFPSWSGGMENNQGQWGFITDHSSVKVGNGRRVLFWGDKWFGHTLIKDKFPELYNIAVNPRISVAEAKSTYGWNIVFRRNLNDWELQSVADFWETLEAFQGLTEEEDALIWKGHKSDSFSVKSAYHFINNTPNPAQGWPWKQIWRVRAPTKVQCFTWLVAREAIPTQEPFLREESSYMLGAVFVAKMGNQFPISVFTVRPLLNFGTCISIWLVYPG